MSNHLITEVYRRRVGGLTRKAVMALIADKANDDGSRVWASKQRMADELGTSRKTIIATIKTLLSDGLLFEVGHRDAPNGYTVEYAINVPALCSLELITANAHDPSPTVTGNAATPVTERHMTRNGGLHKPKETLLNKIEAEKDVLKSEEVDQCKPSNLARLPLTRKVKSAVPENWEPQPFGSSTQCAAIMSRWSSTDLAINLERFVAHHQKTGKRYEDWQAAWKTWVLTSVQFEKRPGSPQQRENGSFLEYMRGKAS